MYSMAIHPQQSHGFGCTYPQGTSPWLSSGSGVSCVPSSCSLTSYRSSLLKVERSMSKVLSALSAECDSALLRSGWDALNLVQLDEPMWKPYSRLQLLLKPLLIARTLLNGILITVTFFSKKVLAINCQAICQQCLLGDGTRHARTCSQPKISLMRAAPLTNLLGIRSSSVPSQSTLVTSTITMRPELSLADSRRESLSCGEIPDAERQSMPTCVTPQQPILCPLEVQEGLGSMDTIQGNTLQWSSTNGMAGVAVSLNSFNGPIPHLCM